MKNKLPPKKAGRKNGGRDDSDEAVLETAAAPVSPTSAPPTTSQQQQQQPQQDISLLLAAMSESRSSSPIALVNKPTHPFHGLVGHHGENAVPNDILGGDHETAAWATSHAAAAADALVNLSNQHSSRIGSAIGAAAAAAAFANSAALHQLPPACGAKQLSKLKRFLTTLVQFGRDLAPEICDRVRLLILALVNNLINVEEFHSKLQDLTGYPLRPFVIPFLKANLPLLQRELAHCARLARQTPQQFLLSNESLVYAPFAAPGVQPCPLSPQIGAPSNGLPNNINNNNKNQSSPIPGDGVDLTDFEIVSPFVQSTGQPIPRRIRSPDNVSVVSSRSSPPNKRVRSRSPINNNGNNNNNNNGAAHSSLAGPKANNLPGGVVQPIAKNPNDVAWITAAASSQSSQAPLQLPPPLTSVSAGGLLVDGAVSMAANDELWRLLDQQLVSLADAASSCRRSAIALRDRSRDELLGVLARARIAGARLGASGASQEVDEIRRRAEEAVNEIKRQACLELQSGVAAAEQKAREMVAAERARMMRELTEARQRGFDEATTSWTKQEENPENCANCGRSASERCSACEQVRYCGRFCQIHDWQRHRLQCRQFAANRRPSSDDQQQNAVVIVVDNKPESDSNTSRGHDSSPPPLPSQQQQQQKPEPLVVPIAVHHHHHRRSKQASHVKPETVSPGGGNLSSSISSSSASCNGQAGRPESRHSNSAAASCH